MHETLTRAIYNKGFIGFWRLLPASRFVPVDTVMAPKTLAVHSAKRCAQWLKIRAEEIKSLADSNGEFQQNRQFID